MTPLTAAMILGVMVVIGLFHASFTQILNELFGGARRIFSGAQLHLNVAVERLAVGNAKYREAEGISESNRLVSYLVGGLLHGALLALFLLTEFYMVALALAAMSGTSASLAEAVIIFDVSPEEVSAAGFLGMGLFWGTVALDLAGITHLARWESTRAFDHRAVPIGIKLLCALIILIHGGLGFYRAMSTLEPLPVPVEESYQGFDDEELYGEDEIALESLQGVLGEEPSLGSKVATGATLTLFPALIAISAAAAGISIHFLPVALLLGVRVLAQWCLGLAALPLAFACALLDYLWAFSFRVFELVARPCRLVAYPIGRLLGEGLCDTHLPISPTSRPVDQAAPAFQEDAPPADSNENYQAQSPDASPSADDDPWIEEDKPTAESVTRNWSPYGQ